MNFHEIIISSFSPRLRLNTLSKEDLLYSVLSFYVKGQFLNGDDIEYDKFMFYLSCSKNSLFSEVIKIFGNVPTLKEFSLVFPEVSSYNPNFAYHSTTTNK